MTQDQQLLNSTYAILFFGTPHHGSSKASWLNYIIKIAAVSKPLNTSHSPLVSALECDSETLQNITLDFVPLMKRFRIFFLWEQEKTRLKVLGNDYIVTSDSAAPVHDETERCGIAATHSDMVKFDSPSVQGFRTVMEALMRYSEDAGDVVAARLREAERDLAREKQRLAMELVGISDQTENAIPAYRTLSPRAEQGMLRQARKSESHGYVIDSWLAEPAIH